MWRGLLTLPLRRQVSNHDPGGRPAVGPGPRNGAGGVWRPAPNTRQLKRSPHRTRRLLVPSPPHPNPLPKGIGIYTSYPE